MRKITVSVLMLLLIILVGTACPVLAIGPFEGAEESENDNFVLSIGGLINTHGNADGSVVWAYSTGGGHWVKWNWKAAEPEKGVTKNALIIVPAKAVGTSGLDNVQFSALLISYIPETTDNKWIFLSGDSGPYTYSYYVNNNPTSQFYHLNLYGARGVLFWMNFWMFKSFGYSNDDAFAVADPIADMYQYGEVWLHNSVPNHPA